MKSAALEHNDERRKSSGICVLLSKLAHRSGLIRILNRMVNSFELARNTGKPTFPFVKRRRHRNVQILLYHRINDNGDPFLPSTKVSTFKTHMQYLSENYNVWGLDEAVDALVRDDVPPNAVVVTFDDGYKDNYDNAFPILKSLSLPATIFLATGVIGTHAVLWHDRVFRAFNCTTVERLSDYGPLQRETSLATPGARASAMRRVLIFLRSLEDSARSEWIDRLVERLQIDEAADAPELMLNWDEVREMSRNGISLGAHTVTHPILARVPADDARREITESKAAIERRLQVPVHAFAYPNGGRGDFTEETKMLVREAGYSCAVTTIFGTNTSKTRCDLMELRRGGASDDNCAAFAARMTFYKL